MPRFIYTSGSVRCLTNRIIHSDNMNRMVSAPLKWRSIDLPPPSGFGRPSVPLLFVVRSVDQPAANAHRPRPRSSVGHDHLFALGSREHVYLCGFVQHKEDHQMTGAVFD